MIYKILGLLLLSCIIAQADEFLYLANDGLLEVKKINPSTGQLTDFQKVEHPKLSKFTFSRNKKFLYAQASIKDKPKQTSIITYKVEKNGKLTFLHNAPITAKTTEIKTDRTDSFLFGAGHTMAWELDNGVYKGKEIQKIKHENKGHAVRFSLDNNYTFVPSTGGNCIYVMTFDSKTGKLKLKSSSTGPSNGAKQPRHFITHPTKNIAYTTQERLNPGVAVWSWDSATGKLKIKQNIVCHKTKSDSLTMADIHMSPDNKFLYASLRDKDNNLDAILLYKINEDGTLNYLERFPCEDIPRSFCINNSGDFLYVAGQKAEKLGVYKINKENGFLTKVTQYETGKAPIWVETITR